MILLISAILFTLCLSAICSLLEAIVLSTTTVEIEALKKDIPKRGLLLERYVLNIEETSSAILSLNTIANTLGSLLTGGLAIQILGSDSLIYFSIGMTFSILIFSEILPKNIGLAYRSSLQKETVYILWVICKLMIPASWVCKKTIQFFIKNKQAPEISDQEIILLAEKSAQEGTLSADESKMISNILKLDEIQIQKIMTPRTVVFALEKSLSIAEVIHQHKNLPFSRIPIYENSIDHVIGVVWRRDVLEKFANQEVNVILNEIRHDVLFIPETISAASVLKEFLRKQQQIAIVVDEFASIVGVITLEDIIENLIGQEIVERDDIAVNMRELARQKKTLNEKNR